MKEDFPSVDQLAEEKQKIAEKVWANRRAKEEDIIEKIEFLDASSKNARELSELLEQAEENLNYYTELQKAGQLPEESQEKLESAQELVSKIREKIKSIYENAKTTANIPEVNDALHMAANKMNKEVDKQANRERKLKEKPAEITNRLNKVIDELLNRVLPKKEKYENLLHDAEEKRNILLGKLVDSKIDEKIIKMIRKYMDFYGSISEDESKTAGVLADYKKSLSWYDFSKKKAVDEILIGEEFRNFKEAAVKFADFHANNQYGRLQSILIQELRDNEELRKELENLNKYSNEDPSTKSLRSGSLRNYLVKTDDINREAAIEAIKYIIDNGI